MKTALNSSSAYQIFSLKIGAVHPLHILTNLAFNFRAAYHVLDTSS